ncbi:MAG: NTPase KAP, partial [candidate division WOR-3 bacterium]|nr:NTPase KAP [candidate division WOR-3 bacterium]
NWLEQISDDDREVIKKLLTRIFPKLEAVFGNISYGGDWGSTWRRQLRISSHEVFPIYFRLSVPEGEIPHIEMQSILALAENSEAFGDKLLELSQQHRPDGSTRVSVFLERLQDYTEKDIPEEDIGKILQALFNIGDKLLLPEDEGRGLVIWGNGFRIGHIMFQLLKRYDTQEERFKVLKEAFSMGQAVSMIVREVGVLGQQHGKYDARADPEGERLVGAQHVEELEKIALEKIKKRASDGKLLKAPNLSSILYGWRDWGGDKSAKKWVSDVITSDKGLVDFLTGFLSKGYIQGMDDRIASVQWRLNPKSLEPFVKPAKIISRSKKLLTSPPKWLKDKKKIAVETFVKWFELQSQGKNPERELKG